MVEIDELYNKILKALKDQTDEIRSDIKSINLQITEKTEKIHIELKKVEAEQKRIKNNLLQLERIKRKNNIVIFGLDAEEKNLLSSVLSQLNVLLGINLCEADINDIYKINRKKESPIKVEFISFLKKKLIFGSIKNLKGKKIYINNDLCKEDLEEQKILRTHLKLAQQKGYKAYIKNRTLVINNEVYTPEQLEDTNIQETISPTPTENNEFQTTSSAPSTPTPLRRAKEAEREFHEEERKEQTPETIINKKNKAAQRV